MNRVRDDEMRGYSALDDSLKYPVRVQDPETTRRLLAIHKALNERPEGEAWVAYGENVATAGRGYDEYGSPADDRTLVATATVEGAQEIASNHGDVEFLFSLVTTLASHLADLNTVIRGALTEHVENPLLSADKK